MTAAEEKTAGKNKEVEDQDFMILEFDEIDEIDPLAELTDNDDGDLRMTSRKHGKARKSIEDILAERALHRQLSDVFDEDLLD